MKVSVDFNGIYLVYANKHLNSLMKQSLIEIEELIKNSPELQAKYPEIRKRILDVHGEGVRDMKFLCEQVSKF